MWSKNCTFFCPNSQRTHLTTFFCPNTAMYRNRLIAWPGLHSPRAALASHSQSIPHWQRQTERGKVKNGPWKSEILTLSLLVTRLQGHLFAFHCQKTARRQWQLKLKRFLSSHKWNQGSLCCMTSLVGTEKKNRQGGDICCRSRRGFYLDLCVCECRQTCMTRSLHVFVTEQHECQCLGVLCDLSLSFSRTLQSIEAINVAPRTDKRPLLSSPISASCNTHQQTFKSRTV